ncbi:MULTISPECIES: hypothetical protein [unclassified Bradyrhizobium]|jgi:hypothetical protein|nr:MULTISPECIES: hypothetical protein [unclassified Bradyrhizobium]
MAELAWGRALRSVPERVAFIGGFGHIGRMIKTETLHANTWWRSI